jgi:hypothetical protein
MTAGRFCGKQSMYQSCQHLPDGIPAALADKQAAFN